MSQQMCKSETRDALFVVSFLTEQTTIKGSAVSAPFEDANIFVLAYGLLRNEILLVK